MLDLKINHLQLLAQIVSTGSLTEAAQNLGLSAAAASRMLKKLQTEMNDPLFIRSLARINAYRHHHDDAAGGARTA